MGKIDKINAFGTMYNVAANSNDVAYNGDNVANVEEAIDELYERTEGGGGGGDTTVVSAAPYFTNGKLPVWKDNMKILIIANSFVQRSMRWDFSNVLNGINAAFPSDPITGEDLYIRQYFAGGVSLAGFLNKIKTAPTYQENYIDLEYENGSWRCVNSPTNPVVSGIVPAIESMPWDVIVLQAWPGDSTEDVRNYQTFSAALKEFVYEIRKHCPNPSVCIGFNMIWPCGNTVFTRTNYMNYYNGICSATKEMISDSGVDLIIPSGTAMANAVNTNTFNGENTHFLMRDTVHAGKGVAEYIVACTIYEAVFAPVFKKSMYNITAVPDENTGDQGGNTYSQANILVSAENLGLCHEIALRAVSDMYHVDETIDPIQP